MAKVSALLALIYVPLMWTLVVLFLALGILGLAMPNRFRALLNVFTHNWPVRLLGLVMLVVGAEMFLHSANTAVPALVKVLGVLLFIDGGVRLIVPTLSVIFTERIKGVQVGGLRLLGLIFIGVAWLFYLATKLPAPPAA